MSSSSSSSAVKKITLKTSDDELFEVEEPVAFLSQTIKNVIDDGCGDSAIPLPNITGPVLVNVIRHCKEQLKKKKDGSAGTTGESEEEGKDDDAKFVKDVSEDQHMLFDLILAANYLNITSLLDLLCKAVADMIKGKNTEQIRKTFNIINDYTKEEIEEVKRENQWAFK